MHAAAGGSVPAQALLRKTKSCSWSIKDDQAAAHSDIYYAMDLSTVFIFFFPSTTGVTGSQHRTT